MEGFIDPSCEPEVYMPIPMLPFFVVRPLFHLSEQDYLDFAGLGCHLNEVPLHVDTEILLLDFERDAETGDYTLSNGFSLDQDAPDYATSEVHEEEAGDAATSFTAKSKLNVQNRYQWRSLKEMLLFPDRTPLYYMDHQGFQPENFNNPIVFMNPAPIYVKDAGQDGAEARYTTFVYAVRQEDCLCFPVKQQ